MAHHTAPPGYNSNFAAILDLIRFGPVIWNSTQFMALLYHAERSASYGKETDRHSEKQAHEGIFSVGSFQWVRAPWGGSRPSWYRANATLCRDGVLVKRRDDHKWAITEYEIDWRAVKKHIERWREVHHWANEQWVEGSQIETPKTGLRGLKLRPLTSQFETPRHGSQIETPDQTADTVEAGKIEGSQIETQQSTLTYSLDLNSRSENFSATRSAVLLEIEIACGQRARTDGPADQILKANRKLGLPPVAIGRFLQEKAEEFRGRNYPFNPALLAKSFAQEIIPWVNRNRRFLEECQRDQQRVREQQRTVSEIDRPEPEVSGGIEREDTEFARGVIDGMKSRVRKLR